ncbi:MAG: CvpA family protein [Clostridiales bacterium]|nr:CvpA family protein [Clostridiales bacterium]
MATIGLVIDIIIVGLLIVFAISGLKKGFMKSIISLFSWVVCIVIAVFVAKYVANLINGIYDFSALIGGKISKSLIKSNDYFSLAVSSFGTKANLIKAIPDSTNKVLASILKVFFEKSNDDIMTSNKSVGEVTGDGLGSIIMLIISAILVFIILKIIVALLSRFFDKLANIKIIGGLDKILGLTLGIIKAGLIIITLNLILVGLSLMPVVNKTITPIIQDNTHVEKVIYNETDKFVEKHVIKGDLIKNWVSDLWDAR